MDGYTITPLKLGTITRKKSNMVYGAEDTPTEFPLLAFLLEGFGQKVLVDTGGSAPDGVRWMPYVRTPEESLPAALAAAGTRPEEIGAVFFTHLHWDHAGNNALLPHAQLYVQREEHRYLAAEDRVGYDRALALRSHYTLLDGDVRDVRPGISVLLTPGHSVGSQCVIAETPEGPVVLTGDLIPTCENLERNVPNGGHYDRNVISASMARVCALNLPVLPGHDNVTIRPRQRLNV